MNVDALVNRLWQGEYREAPAVMERNGVYYMLSSFCTGWNPNQAQYGKANSIDGRWTYLTNIGDSTTYRTQPAFILPIMGEEETTYLYVSDRWDATDYHNSRYVFLPIKVLEDNSLELEYADRISIDVISGRVKTR